MERLPKLFIGPWVGEFGIEILRWQGMARTIAQSRKWAEIIVATRRDRFFLYSDFATKFVAFKPSGKNTSGRLCFGQGATQIHEHYIDESKGDIRLSPETMTDHEWRHWVGLSAARSTYHDFGLSAPAQSSQFTVLIHARASDKTSQDFKNWPSHQYEVLIASFPRHWTVASIGARGDAHKISGTTDLRGISLQELAGHCKAAKVVIGPSSGTIHFASHCRTPILTWIGLEHYHSYYPQWNPFDVPICCLPTWAPEPEVVRSKAWELLILSRTKELPVQYAVIGTKRSGHHGFIEWLASLQPKSRFAHWNDCVWNDNQTYPPVTHFLPTASPFPKEHHKHSPSQSVFQWNPQGSSESRLLSFEGLPIERVTTIPGVQTFGRIIFILRDAANLAASLKQGIRSLQNKGFLDTEFQQILSVYRGYLREAIGETNWLGELRHRVTFVSYNRWHTDAAYRRTLSQKLGFGRSDPSRGKVSSYVHQSGFESKSTDAQDLGTLDRWQEFHTEPEFWTAVSDSEIYHAEKLFHGRTSPLVADLIPPDQRSP